MKAGRYRYVVAAVCAAALLLSACSSSTTDSDTSTDETAAEETETEEEEAEEDAEEAADEAAASEELTGTGTGFGGDVTVTLTVEGDTITACSIDAPDETESIGGAALEELAEQVVAANGPDIDGVSGATLTSDGVRSAVSAALGIEEEEAEEEEEEAEEEEAEAEEEEEEAVKVDAPEGSIQIGAAYGAPHGTQAFAIAIVAVQDDTIVGVYVDEFQFFSTEYDLTPVPNSDSEFAEGYAEDTILASKRVNSEFYSSVMAANAGATISYADNMDAIQEYITGLSVEDTLALAADENAVDAISGATLADTSNYAALIAEAADNAEYNQYVEYDGSVDDLTLSAVYGAAHGTMCFTIAAALTDGETIVAAYVDELQFFSTEYGLTPVPNSDSDEFAEGYAEDTILASKRVNSDFYSSVMASNGGATIAYDENMDALQAYVSGMTIAEAEELAGDENAVDAVTGATLQDTSNYVTLIVEAAQQ